MMVFLPLGSHCVFFICVFPLDEMKFAHGFTIALEVIPYGVIASYYWAVISMQWNRIVTTYIPTQCNISTLFWLVSVLCLCTRGLRAAVSGRLLNLAFPLQFTELFLQNHNYDFFPDSILINHSRSKRYITQCMRKCSTHDFRPPKLATLIFRESARQIGLTLLDGLK